jgi:hypothetical protein
LRIPKNVKHIANNVFIGSSFSSIVVDENNETYNSRDNCNAIIDNMNTLILGCRNTIIPKNVLSIGAYAFRGIDGLQTIELPSSLTTIGYMAFYECNDLSTIEIPDNVGNMGRRIFEGCKNLQSVKWRCKTYTKRDKKAFNANFNGDVVW